MLSVNEKKTIVNFLSAGLASYSKMTSTSLLLFSAALCIAVYSCLGKNPTPSPKKQCEYESIRKCNHEFKKVFKDAKNVTGKYSSRVHAYGVYCDAIQVGFEFELRDNPSVYSQTSFTKIAL